MPVVVVMVPAPMTGDILGMSVKKMMISKDVYYMYIATTHLRTPRQ